MLETASPTDSITDTGGHDAARHRVVLLGGFGMRPKSTMTARALPLGQELAARGHSVTMIVPPWDHPVDAGRAWTDGGVRVINVAVAEKLQTPLRTPRIVAALRAAVTSARPDVVHLFKPKGYGGLAAATLRDLPLVVDTDDWEGAGGWNDRGLYSPAQQRLFAWQERVLPQHAAHVTVASRTLEAQQWGFGIPPNRVTYLPNAVSAARYAGWRNIDAITERAATIRAERGLTGPTVVLYTRFVEFTPDRIARVFGRVQSTVPDARLLIVGGGLHREDSAVRGALREYGDAVLWSGIVPFDAVPAWLRAADVAVIPFEDTLINRAKCSVKTLDLLVVGQAVVATAVGENMGAIRHNETGILVPPGDDAALGDAVARLLADSHHARRLGDAAREHVWRAQTWGAQIVAIEAIYDRVTARSRRR